MIGVMALLVMLFFIGWILFIPIVIDVDTARKAYQVYQYGTIRFWLGPGLHHNLSIFGFSIPMKPGEDDKKHLKKSKPKKVRHIPFRNLPALLNGIYQSITVRWFQLDVDCDNVVMNAKIIPVFMMFSRGPVHLTTNFEGRVYASLRAELKPYRIGWAFLLFYTKK